jgi:uncharacterized protein (DUF2461 family)
MPFAGFPERALVFYEGLLADNTRAYWSDHKAVYDECVAALLDELGPEFGEAKVFRPYRDVRFSKDKTPYKTQAAAVVQDATDVGQGLYLALSADGLEVGGGFHHAAPDQVQRLREAVAHDPGGAALGDVVEGLRAEGWHVGGRAARAGAPAVGPRPPAGRAAADEDPHGGAAVRARGLALHARGARPRRGGLAADQPADDLAA